jgi:hypothetical protein
MKKTVRCRKTHETTPRPIPLEFVHIAAPHVGIDENSRGKIRSHAKRFANLSGSRSGPSTTTETITNEQSVEDPAEKQAVTSTNDISLHIPGVDPFDTSSIKLEPYMLDLLHYCA